MKFQQILRLPVQINVGEPVVEKIEKANDLKSVSKQEIEDDIKNIIVSEERQENKDNKDTQDNDVNTVTDELVEDIDKSQSESQSESGFLRLNNDLKIIDFKDSSEVKNLEIKGFGNGIIKEYKKKERIGLWTITLGKLL